jgi:hypothetical protein
MYLKVYNDNTFEYISKGFIFDAVYSGTVRISHDTYILNIHQKSQNTLEKLLSLIKDIDYLDSPEFIEIKLNKLKIK